MNGTVIESSSLGSSSSDSEVTSHSISQCQGQQCSTLYSVQYISYFLYSFILIGTFHSRLGTKEMGKCNLRDVDSKSGLRSQSLDMCLLTSSKITFIGVVS